MLDAGIAQSYIDILHEELVLATGCTEPIAIAYCAATLQRLLGCKAERVEAVLSGNILKNVKSVVVPNTGGRKGIRPAIAAGMVAGDPSKGLQVISQLPEEKLPELESFLKTTEIDVLCGESPCRLDIDLRAWGGEHSARARITNHHTNLVYLERDGEVLRELPVVDAAEEHMTDKSCLNVEDILRFADTVPLEKVEEVMRVSQDPISLETPVGEEDDSHLGDFIPDDEAYEPADAAAYALLREQLAGVLKTLTPREEKVLCLRYGLTDGKMHTLEEVGEEFNVTRERIRQIEAKALRKLRHPSRSKVLKDFLN